MIRKIKNQNIFPVIAIGKFISAKYWRKAKQDLKMKQGLGTNLNDLFVFLNLKIPSRHFSMMKPAASHLMFPVVTAGSFIPAITTRPVKEIMLWRNCFSRLVNW